MKKQPWGRLGAAISAVALLAGGLVGVAVPANAVSIVWDDRPKPEVEDWCLNDKSSFGSTYESATAKFDEHCSGKGLYEPFRVVTGTWTGGASGKAHGWVGSTSPPVQHEDRVCAYVVSKFVSSAGAAAKECQGLLSNPRDLDKVTESQSAAPNGKYLFTATVSTQYLAAGLDFTPPAEPSDWNQCAEGLFPTGSGCEEQIPVGWPDVSSGSWSDPPPGTTWTGKYDCSDTEPPSGDWVRAYVPDCPSSKTRALDANAWAEYVTSEPVQVAPPPPPCWDASINNCPVGGALRFVAPRYAMVGVPVTMYAYASWRPDANSPAQPTNGTAVIRVDGEDYSGVEFKDGVAEWRFIPETEGVKEFTASGVVSSGLSGANAYIDTVEARTYVLEYDPAAYATALKKKRVEVGDTYVITDPNQARSYLQDRYEWSVSEKSDDVCAVYETKKGAVKAKFNGEGKCTVIWMDKESEEEGKYTFIAKK